MKSNFVLCGAICALVAMPLNTVKASATVTSAVEAAVKQDVRKIASVEVVSVESPVGTVPRLPYQVWVTYSDGTSEFRQVKWSNAALSAEKEQAQYAVGKE